MAASACFFFSPPPPNFPPPISLPPFPAKKIPNLLKSLIQNPSNPPFPSVPKPPLLLPPLPLPPSSRRRPPLLPDGLALATPVAAMLVSVDDDSSGWQESPSQAVLFADEIAAVRAVLGAGLPEARVVAALSRCGGNAQRAINALLDDSAGAAEAGPTDTGHGDGATPKPVKVERDVGGAPPPAKVKAEALDDEVVGSHDSGASAKADARVKGEPADWCSKEPSVEPHRVKERTAGGGRDAPRKCVAAAAAASGGGVISLVPRPKKRPREEVETIDLTVTHPVPYLNPKPIRRASPPPQLAMPARVFVVASWLHGPPRLLPLLPGHARADLHCRG